MTIAHRPAILLVILAGWTIWSAALVALYAALSVGCELGWQDVALGPVSLQRLVLLAFWLLSVAVLAWLAQTTWSRLLRTPKSSGELPHFTSMVAAACSIAACAATLWMGLPILAVSTCT